MRMRFAKLRGSEQHVVPLEHVEAASGSLKILDDLRVLAKLRERDVQLLAKHHNKISHELSRGVLARAPPLEDTDASRTQHKRDVEAFVRDYLNLLHVRSFCVPRLGALHLLPEDVVAEADVTAESRGYESSHSKLRCRRVLEIDRRDRDRIARTLGELSPKAVAAGIALIACVVLLTFWLCYKAVVMPLRQWVGMRGAPLNLATIAVASWLCVSAVKSSLLVLQTPLDMPESATASQMITRLLHMMNDRWELHNGRPLPLAQKVADLEARCGRVIACWTARAANERYFQALKRKRISAKAADDLLRDLAAESLNSEEGVLPGNVEEAQTFLNLAVDEGAGDWEDSSREALMDAIKAAMKPIDTPLLMASAQKSRADEEFEVGMRIEVLSRDEHEGLRGSITLVQREWVRVQIDGERHSLNFLRDSVRVLSESIPSRRPIFKKPIVVDDESEAVVNDENEASSKKGKGKKRQPKPAKARTIEEALREGGWQFKRQRKHIVYERMRVDETGNVQREVYTRACTPSDRRSNSNMLADLNRRNAASPPAALSRTTRRT